MIGIANLYVNGLFFSWIGKLFGGGATALQWRAVLAWGAAPMVVAFLLDLTIKLALQNPANIGIAEPLSEVLTLVLSLAIVVLAAWAGFATMLMLARVQGCLGILMGSKGRGQSDSRHPERHGPSLRDVAA